MGGLADLQGLRDTPLRALRGARWRIFFVYVYIHIHTSVYIYLRATPPVAGRWMRTRDCWLADGLHSWGTQRIQAKALIFQK